MLPFHNKLITRIVLAYLILVAIAVPFLWFFISGSIESNFTNRLARNLEVQATLISKEIPELKKGEGLDPLAGQLKGITGARVTLISSDGTVLGDSDHRSAIMENHINRPEVQESLVKGWGTSLRHSHTIGVDMLYTAVPLKTGGALTGFVRLSMPLHTVKEMMSLIKERVIAGSFLILIAAVVLGVVLSRRLTNKVEEMAEFTKDVASGNFTRRLPVKSGDELGMLAGNLNWMVLQLHKEMNSVIRQNTTLEAVLGGMAEGVLAADREGKVILANDRLLGTFGLGHEEITGRPFLEVIRNSDLLRLFRQAHERRETVSGEVEVSFPERMHFMVGCVPLGAEENFSGVVMVLHDITRMKALERVRRDFVANVTHELKTPIAAIQGFSETLLSGALDEKENAVRFLKIIESNSRRLARLIEDLMTISKIELGEIKLDLKPVSLLNVSNEAAALLEPKIKGKGLQFEINIPEDVPRVMADRDRLYQVILNILDNSVKYTPEGGKITISASAKPGPDPCEVELSIADTGIGIPPEMLPRIGERFFRVDIARSRELGGTGLGLAIVKHIVKAHGSELRVESFPQKGTSISFFLKTCL